MIFRGCRFVGDAAADWHPYHHGARSRHLETARKMSQVDVIFLDLGLPDGDGYEVLAQLRKDPVLQHVPVVAVTARDAATEMALAQAAGFNGFLGKPLNRNRFPDQVRRILAGEGVWEVYH
jgi:two-component system cell cycle response regulator DivK